MKDLFKEHKPPTVDLVECVGLFGLSIKTLLGSD